jgi:hypothetical protein
MKCSGAVPRLLLLSLCLLAAANPATARDLTPAQRLADFDQLVDMIRGSYGMLEHKKQTLGLDLDSLAATYRKQVEGLAGDTGFYDLLSAFLSELKDAHVGHFRPSASSSKLGFEVTRVEAKAIITAIDPKLLPKDRFPFAVGDELVALDGRPVERLVQELIPSHACGTEESSLGLHTRTLTERFGWLGPVPRGVCTMSIRPSGGTDVQTISLPWIVRGQLLPGMNFYVGDGTGPQYPIRPGTTNPDLSYNPIAGAFEAQLKPDWMPEGAHVLESKHFAACTFETGKGPMGYIRIPHFMPSGTDAALGEFRKLLKEMWFTKGLVLDLNDNPGGSLFYCYSLAATLVSRPLALPVVSERASRANLAGYLSWAEWTDDAVEKQMLELVAERIRKAMESDLPMTEFMYSFGVATQAQDPDVNYARPILMLINDQCYSCGDIFPALLKDNGRVKLMGSTTAGAGGAVGSFGPLSHSGSSINLTLNVMRRSSGTFIENVGVAPDVVWAHAQADVAAKYKAYRKAYVDELSKMVE